MEEPKTKASIFWGLYESAEVKFVKNYLQSELDVIEFGSSIGVVSSVIAKKLNHNSRLICVEANSNLLPSLEVNLAVNASTLTHYVENAAIDYSGKDMVSLFINNESHVSSSIYTASNNEIQVHAITLREIITKYSINSYNLVMDIEGAELQVIQNDQSALCNCQQIIAELHDVVEYQSNKEAKTITVNEIISLLKEQGFTLKKNRGPVCFFER